MPPVIQIGPLGMMATSLRWSRSMLYAGLQYVSKGSGWPPVDHGSDLGQHLTLVAVDLHLRDIRDPSPTESGVHAD